MDGKGERFKTFYRYHSTAEIDEMMALFGFKFLKKYPAGDDIRLYVKTRHRVMNTLLTPELLGHYFENDPSISDPTSGNFKLTEDRNARVIDPNPRELAIESLYIRKLRELDPGPENAEIYHRLTANAIARIFKGSLGKMEMKVPIGEGIKEIDTVFTSVLQLKGFSTHFSSKLLHLTPCLK